jgi:hypothetical protein
MMMMVVMIQKHVPVTHITAASFSSHLASTNSQVRTQNLSFGERGLTLSPRIIMFSLKNYVIKITL